MKARTMKRFWAVLLCLVMVLGLLPAAALADEGPEMETTELDITKTVAQAGNVAPGAATFTFELLLGGREDGDGTPIYERLGTATITTYGAGTTQHTLSFQTPKGTVDGEGYTDTIWYDVYLREIPGGDPSWDYSDALYHVTRSTNNDGSYSYTFSLCSEYSGDDPQPTANFINTYTYNFIPDWYYGATITVKKEDTAGEPLAGAVFVLENSRGDAVYEAVSNSRGEASFTGVGSGEYTLLEESAPEGYVKSEQSYELSVRGSSVTMDGEAYVPVTFVNRKAAQLNREDHFTFLVGYDGGSFGPERNMTRAEVTTMFARLLTEQIEADKTYANSFNDVPASHWAANYIGYMEQFGIVTGYADGSFRPDAPVTRAEFASMVASALDLRVPEQNYFSDVAADAWYADGVNAMAAKGFFAGDGSAFRPDDTITYEEMVTVLSSVAAWASLDGYELSQENLSAGDWGNYYQFSDWAQTSARNLDELGALVGDQQPGDAGTRETAAGLLCALMEATHLIWS